MTTTDNRVLDHPTFTGFVCDSLVNEFLDCSTGITGMQTRSLAHIEKRYPPFTPRSPYCSGLCTGRELFPVLPTNSQTRRRA